MRDDALAIFKKEVARDPALVVYLEEKFRETHTGLVEQLLEDADETPFPLDQWAEALRALDRWLDAGGLSLPLADQVGYVSCAAEVGTAGSALTQLPQQVEEMLEAFGCERAVAAEAAEG